LAAELEAERTADAASEQQMAAARAQVASRWVPAIQSRVRQFWLRPTVSRGGLDTVVNLRLEPGGLVVPGSVRVIESSGNAAFDQSVVVAIYQASPLPVPDGSEFDLFKISILYSDPKGPLP
jgi:colicin import membrane protein